MGNTNKSKEKNSYYKLLNKTLKMKQDNNYNNINNINYCLLSKPFSYAHNLEPDIVLDRENINWKNYLRLKLYYLSEDYDYIWAKNLNNYIINKKFPNQYKYMSLFFYEEFQILSIPKLTNFHDINSYSFQNAKLFKKNKNEINNNSLEREDIDEQDNNSTNINNKNGYKTIINNIYGKTKIQMSNDLLGSLASINFDDINSFLIENEPTMKYKLGKAKLKEYIDIFKRHLCHKDHPINIILNKFSKEFSPVITKAISAYKNLNFTECFKKGEEIIHQLQEFMMILQVVIKLFYSKCISYEVFQDEKDEFLNLISFLVFNTGDIYKNTYELLKVINSEKIQNFEKQLNKFGELEPEDFRVEDKFCLNEITKDYMNKYKNNKIKILNKKPEIKNRLLNSQNLNYNEKDNEYGEKENNKNNKYNFNIDNNFFDITNNTMPKSKYINIFGNDDESYNEKNNIQKNLINTNINNLNINIEEEKNEKINNEDDNLNINLNINLTISEEETKTKKNQFLLKFRRRYSSLDTHNENKNKEPYYEAIKTLKNISKCKTPLEKLVTMASISSIITDSIYEFWKPLNQLIIPSFLNVEADEVMKIFIYIVYNSKMSELFVHLDFIKYFTSSSTKTTMIGYYYTLLEGSLNLILEAKNKDYFLK